MQLADVLSDQDLRAIKEFETQVKQILGQNLVSIKLFGSKARKAGGEYSDLDVLVVTKGLTHRIKREIIDAAFEIDLKYEVFISPRVISQREYEDPLWRCTPFIQNIEREGIAL